MFEKLLAYLEEKACGLSSSEGSPSSSMDSRLTADIDLVIDLEKSNVLRCVNALVKREQLERIAGSRDA
ncbi:MAG TPA: hypothetical protein VF215_08260 [Thermoanaerobaculia bacterium]